MCGVHTGSPATHSPSSRAKDMLTVRPSLLTGTRVACSETLLPRPCTIQVSPRFSIGSTECVWWP